MFPCSAPSAPSLRMLEIRAFLIPETPGAAWVPSAPRLWMRLYFTVRSLCGSFPLGLSGWDGSVNRSLDLCLVKYRNPRRSKTSKHRNREENYSKILHDFQNPEKGQSWRTPHFLISKLTLKPQSSKEHGTDLRLDPRANNRVQRRALTSTDD